VKTKDIQAGKDYFISTSNGWGNPEFLGPTSYYAVANRQYSQKGTPLVNEDGTLRMHKSQVLMVGPRGARFWASPQSVRAEWIEAIRLITGRNREQVAFFYDRGRRHNEHLRRKAHRERTEQEQPIKAEFYKTVKELTSRPVSSWDRLDQLPLEVMQILTEAIKNHTLVKS
jgi:hypothetical protein